MKLTIALVAALLLPGCLATYPYTSYMPPTPAQQWGYYQNQQPYVPTARQFMR